MFLRRNCTIATDPSQLIPQYAQKFPHQIGAGSGRNAEEVSLEILDRHSAFGGSDRHRGLHRQPLHRDQAGRGRSAPPWYRLPTPNCRQDTAAKPADAGNLPAAGVKAKGISEKAIFEKTAAERPTVIEKVEAKLM